MKKAFLGLIALLCVAALAQSAAPLLKFVNVGNARLSSIELDLSGLGAAPSGKTYAVWGLDDNGQATLLGSGSRISYRAPRGENLVGRISGAQVSLEDTRELSRLKKPSQVMYSGLIPQAVRAPIRSLMVSAADTPKNTPYDPGLKAQAELALLHGGMMNDAVKAGNLRMAKEHVEHVWNIVSGKTSPRYGDLNRDGKIQNPGDGYGIMVYAQKSQQIAEGIEATAGMPAYIQKAALEVKTCAINAYAFARAIPPIGQQILDTNDLEVAKPLAEQMLTALTTLLNGTDLNINGNIERVQGECGAAEVYKASHGLFDMPLVKQ